MNLYLFYISQTDPIANHFNFIKKLSNLYKPL